MLDIQGSIFHGSVIRDLIKPNMGGQLYAVGITIIVKHILVSMWIISKEDSFGYMVVQLGFSFSRGLHIYTKYKGPNGREIILLVCSFLGRRINCIRLWKGIGKLDIMVQFIWIKYDIQVGSS